MIFLYADHHQIWSVWQMNSRNIHFLVKKAEIESLRPEHQKDAHFLKRRVCVDDSGWHIELDQRYVRSLLDTMGMN